MHALSQHATDAADSSALARINADVQVMDENQAAADGMDAVFAALAESRRGTDADWLASPRVTDWCDERRREREAGR